MQSSRGGRVGRRKGVALAEPEHIYTTWPYILGSQRLRERYSSPWVMRREARTYDRLERNAVTTAEAAQCKASARALRAEAQKWEAESHV